MEKIQEKGICVVFFGMIFVGCSADGPALSGQTLIENLPPPFEKEPRVDPNAKGSIIIESAGLPEPGGEQPIALGDCDGDGDLDAYQVRVGDIYLRDRGRGWEFKSHIDPHRLKNDERAGLNPNDRPKFSRGLWTDLDVDGFLDLIVAGLETDWHRGRGDCTFDPPVRLPRACVREPPQHINAIDVDVDGKIDVVMTCADEDPVRILFAPDWRVMVPPTAAMTRVTRGWYAFGSLIDDIDGDGLTDLILTAEENGGYVLHGTGLLAWKPVTEWTEIVADRNAMSLVPVALHRGRRVAWWIASTSFSDAILECQKGVCNNPVPEKEGPDTYGWGSFSADFNADGWSDVFALQVTEPAPGSDQKALPRLLLSYHDGTFKDVAPELWPLNNLIFSLEMTCGDLDGNGEVVCVVPEPTRKTLTIRFKLEPRGSWAGLRLRGSGANGARVVVDGMEYYYGPQLPTSGGHGDGIIISIGNNESTTAAIHWRGGEKTEATLTASEYRTISQ